MDRKNKLISLALATAAISLAALPLTLKRFSQKSPR
jgi:hypothetical protein